VKGCWNLLSDGNILLPEDLKMKKHPTKSLRLLSMGPIYLTVDCEAMDLYWMEMSQDGLGEWYLFNIYVEEKLGKNDDNSEVLHRILNEKNNHQTYLIFALIFLSFRLKIKSQFFQWESPSWEYQLPSEKN
jgi:hypothetical protein